ncbi:MAG: type II toxin-antitoxin system RelE/ParE family toxin [Erysipelotrichaceae bacterium]|nr:type II toxin-antitoxin system RelE/ParE family toxin [Erysipelotrichaceae bacterium]
MDYKYYCDKNGKSEIIEEITKLNEKSLNSKDSRIKLGRIYQSLKMLESMGLSLPENVLKHIEDGIWELRPGKQRILFYLDSNIAILLSIFVKKTKKTPTRELIKAKRRRDDYLRRKNYDKG